MLLFAMHIIGCPEEVTIADALNPFGNAASFGR